MKAVLSLLLSLLDAVYQTSSSLTAHSATKKNYSLGTIKEGYLLQKKKKIHIIFFLFPIIHEGERLKKDLPACSVVSDRLIPTRTISALYHTPQQIGNRQLPVKSPLLLYTCIFSLLFYTNLTISMTKLVQVIN